MCQVQQEVVVVVYMMFGIFVVVVQQQFQWFVWSDVYFCMDVMYGDDCLFQLFGVGQCCVIYLRSIVLWEWLQYDGVGGDFVDCFYVLLDGFGNEWNDWMCQVQQIFQYGDQSMVSFVQFCFVVIVYNWFGQFQVLVVELVSGEFVQDVGGNIEVEVIQCFVICFYGVVEFCDDLVVGQGEYYFVVVEVVILIFGVYQYEVVGVLQFVIEVMVIFQMFYILVDVVVGRGQCCQGEVQGVGVVWFDVVWELFFGMFVDFICQLWLYYVVGMFFQQFWQGDIVNYIQWVNDVIFGFGYFLVFVIVDQIGYVDGFKWYLWFVIFIFDEVYGYYDYVGDLEEDDVEVGYYYVGWVELMQGVGVFWLVEGGEGLQCGGESGIENVFILMQGNVGVQVVFLMYFVFVMVYVDVVVVVILCWDVVILLQLMGDILVLNIVYSGEVYIFVLFWYELNIIVFNGFDCWFGQYVCVYVLLVGQYWFDYYVVVIVVRDGQVVWFDFFQQVEGVNCCNNGFMCCEVFQFLEFCWDFVGVDVGFIVFGVVDFCVFVNVVVKGKDVDYWQLVMMIYFVVVKVVCWGDFYVVGVFFYVGVFVVYDWDVVVNQWQYYEFVNQIFVVWIFWVNGYVGIVQQGFWMGGGDYQVIFIVSGFCVIGQWVVDVLYGIF